MNQPLRQCVIVVNNTAAPANSGSGAAAKIGIIGRCPKFFAGRVCYTPSGAPETAESIAYFGYGEMLSRQQEAARRPVLLLEI